MLEKKKVGGMIGNVSTVTHYSGIIEQETARTFANRLHQQALHSGVEIQIEEVNAVQLHGPVKEIKTTGIPIQLLLLFWQMALRQGS